MELQQIDVFIEKDGKVRIEVRGVKGKSCLDLTNALEQALGGKVARELTGEAEAPEPEELPAHEQQRLGR